MAAHDPGGCPLPDNARMDDAGGGQKRSLAAGTHSPPKRAGGEGLVDMGALRQLLADQASMIMEAQRQHLDQTLGKRDAEVEARFSRVEDRMAAQEGSIDELRTMLQALAKAPVSRSGDGSTALPERAGGDRYRYTLVWGGWDKDTRRQVILGDLRKALTQLQVERATAKPDSGCTEWFGPLLTGTVPAGGSPYGAATAVPPRKGDVLATAPC